MTTPTQIAYNVGAGNVTLPHPSAFRMRQLFHGSGSKMADGSTSWDLTSTTVRHTFAIQWTALTDSDLTTVKTFFAAIKNTTCTFIDPQNTSHSNVTRDTGSDLDISIYLVGGGNMRYDVSLTLIQD